MKRSVRKAWSATAISLLLCVFWHAGADVSGAQAAEVTNLALYSEKMEHSLWLKNFTPAVDQVIAPDGNQSAEKFTETSTLKYNEVYQAIPTTLTPDGRYTLSIHLKQGSSSRDWFYLYAGRPGSYSAVAWFNLRGGYTGNVYNGGGSPASTLEDLGGGWFRCTMTFTYKTGAAYFGLGISPYPTQYTPPPTPISFGGYALYHFYAWGAQLESGESANVYLATLDQPVTQTVGDSGGGGETVPLAEVPVFDKTLGLMEVDMQVPSRVDVDSAGNLYFTGTRDNKVLKYDQYGRLRKTYSGFPVSGTGIAVTPDGQFIYVAGHDVVTVVNADTGSVAGQLGSGVGEFVYVGEIDLDADGWVYVADTGTNFIRIFPPFGGAGVPSQFGGPGNAKGKFLSLWGLTVHEATGEVYIADNKAAAEEGPEVQVFKLVDGVWTWQRTLVGANPNNFGSEPFGYFGGMTFDQAGRGYFLDILRGQFRVLSLPQSFIHLYEQSDRNEGGVAGPKDIIYDPLTQRLIVVCDSGRVVKLGIDGGTNPTSPNRPPGTPTALGPVDDSEVASIQPSLTFQNAVDPDGDALTYDVRVFSGDLLVAEYTGLASGIDRTTVQVSLELDENARYTWSARAFDGEEYSAWVPAEGFYVNAVDEPPTAPVLTAPAAAAVVAGEDLLTWTASVDPDPYDSVVGYRLEIAEDAEFATLTVQETFSGTSAVLGELADYPALQDGASYVWRVVAVDNDQLDSIAGEAGTFLFDTTLLNVDAGISGAKVYAGGNLAYPGRYLGETPLSLRDFRPGMTSLVIEAAGFEPYVTQLQVVERENFDLFANLVPAVLPDDLKARPLHSVDGPIQLAGDAAPFAVDFDNDGLVDLLTGEASGRLVLYRGGMDAEGGFLFQPGVSLEVPTIPGAVPFVVDWTNDGRKDLLVGGADGSVTLFQNVGTESAPAFAAGALVEASGVAVGGGFDAVPAVVDIDGDGDKDLVVGSTSNKVMLYRNDGSDEAPQLTQAGSLLNATGPLAPCFFDWNADGTRELLVAANEHLYVCQRLTDGTFQLNEVLTVGDDLVGKSGKAQNGAYSLGERLRIFAFDFDGKKGKDLFVGNAGGEIRLANSYGTVYADSYYEALLSKVQEIGTSGDQTADGSTSQTVATALDDLAAIAAAIEVRDLKEALKLLDKLAGSVDPGTGFAEELNELHGLLD